MSWLPGASPSRICPRAHRKASRPMKLPRGSRPHEINLNGRPIMETSVTLDFLGDLRRTHSCGQLRASDEGKSAVLMGWVHRRRDLGGVLFMHLRDRDGVTQLVFREDGDPTVLLRATEVRSEYVIAIEVSLLTGPADTINPTLKTGEVEAAVARIWILNESRPRPFPMEDE